MQPVLTLIEPRPVDEALGETSSAAPHWGVHTGDPLDHTASAALVGDASDPLDHPIDRKVMIAYRAGRHDEAIAARRAAAARDFRRLLWGAFIGLVLAMVTVVGGCAVIAAMDRGAALPVLQPSVLSGGPVA